MPRDRLPVPLVLTVAVLAVSSAAVLVRLAGDVDPAVIAFWRTTGVALLLAPAVRRLPRRDALWTLVAGACLAGHFWSWFWAIGHTSVLRSTVLVTTCPIWLGLMEWAQLRTPPRAAYWAGVGLALAGIGLLAAGEQAAPSLKGDALALTGGVLGAAYLLIGRDVRQRVGIAAYGSLVCAAAALVLLVPTLTADGPRLALGTRGWLAVAGLTLGPQLLGHNGFNYAVRYVRASLVSTAMLLEPVGATALAWLLLGERPGGAAAVGGLLVVAGVVRASWRPRSVRNGRSPGTMVVPPQREEKLE